MTENPDRTPSVSERPKGESIQNPDAPLSENPPPPTLSYLRRKRDPTETGVRFAYGCFALFIWLFALALVGILWLSANRAESFNSDHILICFVIALLFWAAIHFTRRAGNWKKDHPR